MMEILDYLLIEVIKLGTYGISEDEIAEAISPAIEETLSQLEGDFDAATLKKGLTKGLKEAEKLKETYAHKTDRLECKKCYKTFSMYWKKGSRQRDEVCWICPHCKTNNE